MTHRPVRDRGASALEYGLIVGGVVMAFLIAFAGLQAAVGAVFGRVVSSVQDPGPVTSEDSADIPGGARSRPIPEPSTDMP